tara:strand:+ start:7896 stop:8843 length:948 start_codon:yes stop_codon:yes gene_type:complete
MQNNSTGKSDVSIYTDGACDPNPGPGGWAAIIIIDSQQKQLQGSELNTTNNRMELLAVINALSYLKPNCKITLHTDSKYVQKGITEWIAKWKSNNWKNSKKQPVANQDLWKKLINVIDLHQINWKWVKGHSDNYFNNLVDSIARSSIVYKQSSTNSKGLNIFIGASYINPNGPGGWAAIIINENQSKILAGQQKDTTANKLQLWCVLQALQHIDFNKQINIHTSSKYLYQGANEWLSLWKKRNWKSQSGQSIKHKKLWENVLTYTQKTNIKWCLNNSTTSYNLKAAKKCAQSAANGKSNKQIKEWFITHHKQLSN